MMAIDIRTMSINVKGIDNWFDYADVLQELADEVTNYQRTYRDSLSTEQKNNLRAYANQIRDNAENLATKAAILKLENHQTELSQLKSAIAETDNFLTEVKNAQQVVATLAKVIDITVDILKFAA